MVEQHEKQNVNWSVKDQDRRSGLDNEPEPIWPRPQIDWRKVAAKLSSDAEISRAEMLSGKHPQEVTLIAGCVAEILASLSRAIEDGLS